MAKKEVTVSQYLGRATHVDKIPAGKDPLKDYLEKEGDIMKDVPKGNYVMIKFTKTRKGVHPFCRIEATDGSAGYRIWARPLMLCHEQNEGANLLIFNDEGKWSVNPEVKFGVTDGEVTLN